MFDKVDPDDSAFEALKQFCHLIGEGRMEDKKEEIHFKVLWHPTVPGALLIVHFDVLWSKLYIRELVEDEGFVESLVNLPLVHSFSDPKYGRPIFPFIAEYLDATKTRYHYCVKEGDPCTFEDVPREQYLRLKLLFDEKNPFPWEEK
ncbi:hypothetical protein LCGC14_1006120 [marine sediment metagenome]|uniref:Uncharacterized protein n=1 Tax=marine sediment metagenome TaxID=412755 RepID=A0A0F9NN17_9ZZZZ